MDREVVWVDVKACTGCGACVPACPLGAISLMDGKAHVDEEACDGCHACVRVCPERAIQPILKGELVQVSQPLPPAPYVARTPERTVTAGAVVAGLGLLGKVAGALARALEWYSAGSPIETGTRPTGSRPTVSGGSGSQGGTQGGRRARHRRRGG